MRLAARFATLVAASVIAHATFVSAEIEKIAQPCEQGICFYWWPRLPDVNGWHHERAQSFNHGVNALAPDGFTFAEAESVIYARALYKPRVPEKKSLAVLIESDKADTLGRDPTIQIAEGVSLATADGQKLRTLTFVPSGAGNWERVAYGEEDEFYLLFAVSSRSEQAYKKALVAYEELVRLYRAKPEPTSAADAAPSHRSEPTNSPATARIAPAR